MLENLEIIFVCLVFLLCFVWNIKGYKLKYMFCGFFYEIYLILFIFILLELILDSE